MDNLTEYINFTIQTNCTAKTIWLNHNSKPWMTKDIKESIKKLYDSKLQGTDEQYKSTQKNVNNIIKQAKFQYKSKTLDKMSTNMKAAWKGIKAMSYQNKRTPDIATTKSQKDLPK